MIYFKLTSLERRFYTKRVFKFSSCSIPGSFCESNYACYGQVQYSWGDSDLSCFKIKAAVKPVRVIESVNSQIKAQHKMSIVIPDLDWLVPNEIAHLSAGDGFNNIDFIVNCRTTKSSQIIVDVIQIASGIMKALMIRLKALENCLSQKVNNDKTIQKQS